MKPTKVTTRSAPAECDEDWKAIFIAVDRAEDNQKAIEVIMQDVEYVQWLRKSVRTLMLACLAGTISATLLNADKVRELVGALM